VAVVGKLHHALADGAAAAALLANITDQGDTDVGVADRVEAHRGTRVPQ
jgi:hypothetical protein